MAGLWHSSVGPGLLVLRDGFPRDRGRVAGVQTRPSGHSSAAPCYEAFAAPGSDASRRAAQAVLLGDCGASGFTVGEGRADAMSIRSRGAEFPSCSGASGAAAPCGARVRGSA